MGIHDDEFPDDHSHEPQELDAGGGHAKHGVFVTDEEGRHYWLEHEVTNEGVIVNVYDRYGGECLATWARTYDEVAQMVFAQDPMPDYTALIRTRVDLMEPRPDEVYDSNRLRIARWGAVTAWTDGPRADYEEHQSEFEARVEFTNAIPRAREESA